MFRLYRHLDPAEVTEAARSTPQGHAARGVEDRRKRARAPGGSVRAYRAEHVVDGRLFRIDAVEAPGSADQDRVVIGARAGGVTLALADGAGGSAGGADAATRVTDALQSAHFDRPEHAQTAMTHLDALVKSEALGRATGAVASVELRGDVRVVGASVGDSQVWIRANGRWVELSEAQRPKPLLGSGRARPMGFGPVRAEQVLLMSDGLSKYTPFDELARLLAEESPRTPFCWVDLVRLASGALRDDVSAIWLRPARDATQPAARPE